MPGSVANAAPATVFPASLYSAFTRSQEYASDQNTYQNGENQRRALTTTSRKSWNVSKRLIGFDIFTLRTFYDSRRGPLEAFFIYDLWETVPKFTPDPTGAATAGRYTVTFVGSWEQSMGLARGDVGLQIVEVA